MANEKTTTAIFEKILWEAFKVRALLISIDGDVDPSSDTACCLSSLAVEHINNVIAGLDTDLREALTDLSSVKAA